MQTQVRGKLGSIQYTCLLFLRREHSSCRGLAGAEHVGWHYSRPKWLSQPHTASQPDYSWKNCLTNKLLQMYRRQRCSDANLKEKGMAKPVSWYALKIIVVMVVGVFFWSASFVFWLLHLIPGKTALISRRKLKCHMIMQY